MMSVYKVTLEKLTESEILVLEIFIPSEFLSLKSHFKSSANKIRV